MSDNFDDNISSENSIILPQSNIIEYETSSFKFDTMSPSNTKFLKELLQELYAILLNLDFAKDDINQLNIFINNSLFEYDLDL